MHAVRLRHLLASAAIWLVGGGLINVFALGSADRALLDFSSLFTICLGSLTIVLAATLLGRWIWVKSNQMVTNRKDAQSSGKQDYFVTDKWNALVKYDDDVAKAVEQLRPFGPFWVNELAKAYFSLEQDKRYLPNIVIKLAEEAKQKKAEEIENAKADDEQRRKTAFRHTAVGEVCTEESLQVLLEAKAKGYTLTVANDLTIIAAGTETYYLHSNADIEWFGKMLRGAWGLSNLTIGLSS